MADQPSDSYLNSIFDQILRALNAGDHAGVTAVLDRVRDDGHGDLADSLTGLLHALALANAATPDQIR
jgi:hypothetical protein